MRARLLAVVLLQAVVSFACGDAGDGTDSASSTSSTTAAEAKKERAGNDEALAEAIVLREADLPDVEDVEWSSEPRADDGDDTEALRTCLGLPADSGGATADSPTFRASDVTTVNSSVTVFVSDADARQEFSAAQGSNFAECVGEGVEAQVAQRDDIGPVKVETLNFAPVGEETRAVRAGTTIELADGETAPLFIDVVAVRKGRALMTLTLLNAPEPFPAELAVPLAEAMAARA